MTTTTVKYPAVSVRLVGENGNAFSILGRVHKALRQAGVPKAEADAFVTEAQSGDYDHLLQTVMRWVQVDLPELDDNIQVECDECGCEWDEWDINDDGRCPDCAEEEE
jgi:hypothetical protein